MSLVKHTSIFACSSALASGTGIPRPTRSRGRDFLTPSTLALPAALNLQMTMKLNTDFCAFYSLTKIHIFCSLKYHQAEQVKMECN